MAHRVKLKPIEQQPFYRRLSPKYRETLKAIVNYHEGTGNALTELLRAIQEAKPQPIATYSPPLDATSLVSMLLTIPDAPNRRMGAPRNTRRLLALGMKLKKVAEEMKEEISRPPLRTSIISKWLLDLPQRMREAAAHIERCVSRPGVVVRYNPRQQQTLWLLDRLEQSTGKPHIAEVVRLLDAAHAIAGEPPWNFLDRLEQERYRAKTREAKLRARIKQLANRDPIPVPES